RGRGERSQQAVPTVDRFVVARVAHATVEASLKTWSGVWIASASHDVLELVTRGAVPDHPQPERPEGSHIVEKRRPAGRRLSIPDERDSGVHDRHRKVVVDMPPGRVELPVG